MRAMVLAAGRGERLRPITDTVPKPLVPVGGKPLIVHHLEKLAGAGIREVVVNLSWLAPKLMEALGDGGAFGVHLTYSDEGAVALETGGGIMKALPLLGPGAFLVVNGDTWSSIDFRTLAAKAGADDCAAALGRLVLVDNPPQHPHGDFGLRGDRVTDESSGRLTYSGVALIHPDLFAGCAPGRFPLAPLLKQAIAAGRLRGERHVGEWWDVGSPERLAALDARLSGPARGG